jgi:hypothetical protein
MRLASLPRKSRMQERGDDALQIPPFGFIVPYSGPVSCEDETKARVVCRQHEGLFVSQNPWREERGCIHYEYPA